MTGYHAEPRRGSTSTGVVKPLWGSQYACPLATGCARGYSHSTPEGLSMNIDLLSSYQSAIQFEKSFSHNSRTRIYQLHRAGGYLVET